MMTDRVRRAQLIVAILAILVGISVMIDADFSFSGAGGRLFLIGDSYPIGSLMSMNATGGAFLVVAGVLGAVSARAGVAAAAWLGAALCVVGAVVVFVGLGDKETLVGQGNASNAAVLLTVAVGLGALQWGAGAARADTTAV